MTPWTTLARGTTALFIVVAIATAATVFAVKTRVQSVADRAEALGAAIETERRAIHVLRAEWSHLTDPERLRDLAGRHLQLRPLRPDQLGSFATLAVPVAAADPANLAVVEPAPPPARRPATASAARTPEPRTAETRTAQPKTAQPRNPQR